MADKYHTTRSFNRILRLTLFSFLMFGVVNATFLVRNPNENEIIFETERILLECTAANSVSNPTFAITDAQGSFIVRHNVFVAARVDNSEAAYTNTSYQLLLQITISDQSRSSLSCQIFGDGMLVSEEALTLDVRSSDEPACVIRKESPVLVGDYIELGCYQGRVTGGNVVIWRQIRGNGMSSEDLTSTNSGVINQFKMKTSASLTVTAEDTGSVFQCTVMSGDEESQCMTEQISVVVDTLTVNFSPPNDERLEVGETRVVQCIPSDPSASVMWQHGFDGSADVQVLDISSSHLLIKILESSTLPDGVVLNFECIATLGQLRSTGNFQVVVEVVDLPPSTTSVPIFDSPVEFMPVTPSPLQVGEEQTVTCLPPDQSAEVVWQHDYDQSTDVLVNIVTSAILYISLPHSTTLTNGSILKFECIVTLGRRQANGTFEIVVAALPPSTSVPVTERKTTTTGYYPSTPPVMNNVTMEIPATGKTTPRDQTTAGGGNDEPSGGSDDDPPMTLYFVIGGIVATILIALILIIVVAICITHSNTPKTKQIPEERSIKNSSYEENDTYDDQGERYAEVSKANPARIVSSPDVVPYSDVTKRHVLIDEDEIYDESQNWRNAEDI